MLEADVVRDGMMVASIVALTEAMFMVMGIMSVRSVRHLMRAWEAEGFAGVVREGRSDCVQRRIDEEWTQYILVT